VLVYQWVSPELAGIHPRSEWCKEMNMGINVYFLRPTGYKNRFLAVEQSKLGQGLESRPRHVTTIHGEE